MTRHHPDPFEESVMWTYVSLPAECEAVQYLGDNSYTDDEQSEIVGGKVSWPWKGVELYREEYNRWLPFVTTIHGQMTFVEYQDWIVLEPDGIHYYPVKPEIFEKRWKLKGEK